MRYTKADTAYGQRTSLGGAATLGGMIAESGWKAKRHATNTTRACSPMTSRQMQGVYTEAQERQERLTHSFFEACAELVDRARRGQAAGRNFAWEESADHYASFLECLFFYYREDARAVERSAGGAEISSAV
jgi:hypothetical protein